MSSLARCGGLASGLAPPFALRRSLALVRTPQPPRGTRPRRVPDDRNDRRWSCRPLAAYDGRQSDELTVGTEGEARSGRALDEGEAEAGNTSDEPPATTPSAPLTTREKLLQHVEEVELEDGSVLQVRALRAEEISRTEGILTEAFSDAMGYVPAYRQYLGMQIGSYLKEHINLTPLAVVLVASLTKPKADNAEMHDKQLAGEALPISCSEDEDQGQAAVAGGGDGEVVATLELSFNPSTRTKYLTLDPPPRCAYLINMAVASEYRRQGLGTKLLLAAEVFARLANEHQIFLHVRLQDKDAFALYANNGYDVLDKDMMLLSIFGMNRRYLMRKTVRQLFSNETPP